MTLSVKLMNDNCSSGLFLRKTVIKAVYPCQEVQQFEGDGMFNKFTLGKII